MSDTGKKIGIAILVIILLLGIGGGAFYLCYIEKIDVSVGSSNQPLDGPLEIAIGDKVLMSPVFPDKIYISKKVTFSSSDPSVAEISSAGELIANKVGETTITLTTALFNRKATATVIVDYGIPDKVEVVATKNEKQYVDDLQGESVKLDEIVYKASTTRKGKESMDPEKVRFKWDLLDVTDIHHIHKIVNGQITDVPEFRYAPTNKYQKLRANCTIVYDGIVQENVKAHGNAAVFNKITDSDFEICVKQGMKVINQNDTIKMGEILTLSLKFSENAEFDTSLVPQYSYSVDAGPYVLLSSNKLKLEKYGTYKIVAKITEEDRTIKKEFVLITDYADVTNIYFDRQKEIDPVQNIEPFDITVTWNEYANPLQTVELYFIGYNSLDEEKIYCLTKDSNGSCNVVINPQKEGDSDLITFNINGEPLPEILIDIKKPYAFKVIAKIGEIQSVPFEYVLALKDVENLKVFANTTNTFTPANIKQVSDDTINGNRYGETIYIGARNYPLDSYSNVVWYVNGEMKPSYEKGNILKINCQDVGEYHVYCTDESGKIKSNTIVIPSVDTSRKKVANEYFDYIGDYNGRSVNRYITSQSDLDSLVEYSILTDGNLQVKKTMVYVDPCMQHIWASLPDTGIYTGERFWVAETSFGGSLTNNYFYINDKGTLTSESVPVSKTGSVARSFYRLAYSGNFAATVLTEEQIKNRVVEITVDSPTDTPTRESGQTRIQQRKDSLHQDTFNYTVGNYTRHFPIDEIEQTINVETSSQLFDAIENGYKPICKPGSNAYYIYNEAREILGKYLKDDDSDYRKVKFINDWIVFNVTYDFEASKVSYPDDDKQGVNRTLVYSAFYLEGVFSIPGFESQIAVCDGRSKAVTLMCAIEGIKSVRVTGTGPGGGHAWNKVYIATPENPNPAWYVVDTTWNDKVVENGHGIVLYELTSDEYFLVTDTYHNRAKDGNPGWKEDKRVGGVPVANTPR